MPALLCPVISLHTLWIQMHKTWHLKTDINTAEVLTVRLRIAEISMQVSLLHPAGSKVPFSRCIFPSHRACLCGGMHLRQLSCCACCSGLCQRACRAPHPSQAQGSPHVLQVHVLDLHPIILLRSLLVFLHATGSQSLSLGPVQTPLHLSMMHLCLKAKASA